MGILDKKLFLADLQARLDDFIPANTARQIIEQAADVLTGYGITANPTAAEGVGPYKLKPCPCGGKAKCVTVQAGASGAGSFLFYNIRCESCGNLPHGAWGGVYTTMKQNGKVEVKNDFKKAAEAWNRRAADV